MNSTFIIINAFNVALKLQLIPKGSEPIYCNSVTNVNSNVFQNPIKK